MNKWVILNNDRWLLRPVQNGLELVTLERNITLELSDLGRRDEIASILSGRKEISVIGEKDVKEIIENLAKQGILRYSERQGDLFEKSGPENKVWQVREKLVGPSGPIHDVYWLDPSQSRFAPKKTYFFTAKYLESDKTVARAFANDQQDRNLAELKAIMEALERYACGVIPLAELIKTSAIKLGKKAIDPRRIIAYTEKQYQKNSILAPFSSQKTYYWKEVATFPGKEKLYLPADLLYFPLDEKVFPRPYTLANSSGVAAGFSLEEALLRGLYEAIERDAFMMVWLGKLVKPVIQKTSLPNSLQKRIEKIEQLGYQIFFVDITFGFAPVILAVAVNKHGAPALILGTASNIDALRACSKALSEVEQQLYWDLRSSTKPYTLLDYRKVKRVSDHAALYRTPRYLAKASFLWSGDNQPLRSTRKNSGNELEWVLKILTSNEKEIIVADLTPSLLKDVGIWVIKAIPIGLIPISFGYGMEPLGMPRLKKLSNKIIPFTHPFA